MSMVGPGTKKAILLGATGLVGRELLEELLRSEAYGEVRIVVRRPLPERDKLTQRVLGDWETLEERGEWFADVEDVFCCLGTTIKKAGTQASFRKVDYDYPLQAARLAQAAGARRFLVVTAMGASPSAKTFYSRVKGELEAALRELRLPSVAIVRPSLLLGGRQEFRFGERAAIGLTRLLGFAFRGALFKYKPIRARDVAHVMRRVAQMYLPGTHVFENEQLHRMAEAR